MAMNLAPVPRQRYFDANGNPLAGGKLYTYQAGTSTPQATYTDSSGVTPNTNPVVLDANGEAGVWLNDSQSYKFILKDANDAQQWSQDNVSGAPSVSNSGITTAKIADDAVTAAKLRDDETTDANRAVTTNHIRDSAVTTNKINNSAVTTAKIADANVTTAKIATGAVTQTKLAALDVQITSSSGAFNVASTSDVAPDLVFTLPITTTGRPVALQLIPDGSGSSSGLNVSAAVNGFMTVLIYRDGVEIYSGVFGINAGAAFTLSVPPSSVAHTDIGAVAAGAGAKVYTLKAYRSNTSLSAQIARSKLIAYEL